MNDRVKIAGVQIAPQLMQPADNLQKILDLLREAAAVRADLIVFPECSLTGYVYSSREEALPFAEIIPGPATEKVASLCRELAVHAVFGLLEKDAEKLFNTVVLIGPGSLIGTYRKIHLPYLGVDRFVDPGDRPFQVYQTPIGNIGMEICRDLVFPESSRVLSLLGADILVLPTNYAPLPWSRMAEKYADCFVPTRAIENRVHMVAIDRVGTERGYKFVGASRIVNAGGEILARSNTFCEEIIYGEVSLAMARQKRVVTIPGEWEADVIQDRRPDFYGEITRSS
ncbi:carbon-nitrogen hydrolase family protein [Chloroflexota bacterium]